MINKFKHKLNKNIIIREKNETLKKIYTYIYIYIFKVKTISGFTVLTSKWAFYQILFDRSIKSNSMVSQLHSALPPHRTRLVNCNRYCNIIDIPIA